MLGCHSTKKKVTGGSMATGKESVTGAARWRWEWRWFERGVAMFREGWGQNWDAAELWKNALAKTGGDAWAAKWLVEGWRKAWDWKLEAQLLQQRAG